jgi:hypothetical protein
MTATADDADRRLLEDFLLGRLPDAEAQRVADRLAHDSLWQALVEGLAPSDSLIEEARVGAAAAATADAPSLAALMRRLEQLRLSTDGTRTGDGDLSTRYPLAPPARLWFLRPPLVPDELGRLAGFRILEVLGQGGMGLVLRAEDVQLRRQVALKVIRPERAADPATRERFLREARSAALLQHDHVMVIHQVGEDNGVPFLTMPLLTGQTLAARLSAGPPLTVAEQLRIGREIAEGLAAAHDKGLIHRDIKPSNVWLEEPQGRVKVLDFGLARSAVLSADLTPPEGVLGTPAYMSPEQAHGRALDARSDLFSLGCVLFQMATGTQPFARDSVEATMWAVMEHQPPAPLALNAAIPPALSGLITGLLAKDPDNRPRSAREVAEILRRLEAGESVPTTDLPALPARRLRPGHLIAAAVAAVLLIGVGVFALGKAMWPGRTQETATTPAEDRVVAPAYVTAEVWIKSGEEGRQLRLSDSGALPLRNGEQYRIEAKAGAEAYVYLFLLDDDGEAHPLYPWQPGKWGTRPAQEEKVTRLGLPPREGNGYTINGAGSGMWTILLLTRTTPWDKSDEEIQSLFAGLPAQRPMQDPRSAVWFENGELVRHDRERKWVHFEEKEIDDPVLRMQGLLRERLQPHAASTAAVSFAKQEK